MRGKRIVLTNQKVYAIVLVILILLQAYSIFNISNTAIEQRVIILTAIGSLIMLFVNYKVIGSTWNFLILLMCVGALIITCLLHSGLGSALMAFNLLVFATVFNNIGISQTLYRVIHILCAIFLTYYLLIIDMSTAYSTTVLDKFGNRLNTNVVALWALAALLHWVSFLYTQETKRWLKGVIFVLLSVFAGYYIIKCNSRTALIALTFFWTLCIFVHKPIRNSTYRKITVALLLISLLFPIIYIGLIGHITNFRFLGKSFFSGRQNVWNDALEAIKKYPLFGSGNDIMMSNVQGTYTSSSHNMLLGMWKMFGIIPTFTVAFSLVNNNNTFLGERNRISQFAFLASLLCCFFESFYTYSHLYFFFSLFLIAFVRTGNEGEMDSIYMVNELKDQG